MASSLAMVIFMSNICAICGLYLNDSDYVYHMRMICAFFKIFHVCYMHMISALIESFYICHTRVMCTMIRPYLCAYAMCACMCMMCSSFLIFFVHEFCVHMRELRVVFHMWCAFVVFVCVCCCWLWSKLCIYVLYKCVDM